MNSALPNSIVSPEDLKAVVLELKAYTRWFIAGTIRQRISGNTGLEPPSLSAASVLLLKDLEQHDEISQASLGNLLDDLTSAEENWPRVTITLAAPPSGQIKKELADWCRHNIKPNLLISFKFSAALLGGMTMQYGSHIYDWSFRRQILANRQRFPEILRHV